MLDLQKMIFKKRKIANCILTDESTIFVDILGSSFLIQEDKNNISNIWELLNYVEEEKAFSEIYDFLLIKQEENNIDVDLDSDLEDVLKTLEESGIIEVINKIDDAKIDDYKKFSGELNFFDFFTSFMDKSKYKYFNKLIESKVAIVNDGNLGEIVLNTLNQIGIHDISYYNFQDKNIIYSQLKDNINTPINVYNFNSDDNLWKNNLINKDLILVLLSNKNRKIVKDLNNFVLENKSKILFVEIDNISGKIGPAVVGGETSCYECSYQRRRLNIDTDYLKYFDLLENNEEKNLDNHDNYKTFFPFYNIIAQYSVIETMKILTGYLYPETYRGIYKFNFVENKITHHPVLKFPYCPACGNIDKVPSILDSNKEVIKNAD